VATYFPDAENRVEGEIDTYPSVWTPHQASQTFDENVTTIERDYGRWLKLMPSVPQALGLVQNWRPKSIGVVS